jgi:7,8-dihydropterin-6-yl-methyl-4-(beta-D-ribofuranosyl)aminobenzene 5'-phosphate synthase
VDYAVLSHGHYDHGGGLPHFLSLNAHAPVYVHGEAFLPHYSLRENGLAFIGLDSALEDHPQIHFCDGVYSLSSGGKIFSLGREKTDTPPGNRWLYGPDKQKHDTFCHEQNLLLEEGGHTVLFAGCAHKGIVSIMQEATRLAGHSPTHVFAGMHLVKSGLLRQEEERYIHDLAQSLRAFPHCHYYTMHCTGVELFEKLRTLMPGRISYLGTGEAVEVD